MQINDVTLAGYVGHDAEERVTAGGTRIITFSIACTEKGKGDAPERTFWVRAKVFGNWCDYASTIKKGDNVLIKGRLDINEYESKTDGQKRTSVEVVCFSLGILRRDHPRDVQKAQIFEPRTAQSAPPQTMREPPNFGPHDDIPF